MSRSDQVLLEGRWLYELHRRGRRTAPAVTGRARGERAAVARSAGSGARGRAEARPPATARRRAVACA
jgi:hypothetical protein